MTGLGPSHVPPAGTDDDPDIPWWVVGIAIAVALALAIALGTTLLSPKDPEASGAAGPTHPQRWDKRVAPYAKLVERQRGLDFRHPVTVRFLKDRAFEKSVRADEDELTAEDRQDIKHATELLRAFGLVSGKVDLFGATNDAHGAGTLAYYSFDDQRITIRGKKLTAAARSTLVHELTHALQDQHFYIGDRVTTFEEASESGEPDRPAYGVLRAIVEGDAERVERLYRESLTPQQERALAAGRASLQRRVEARLRRVPPVLMTMIAAPYALGTGLVEAVAADGGGAAVDHLLRTPPKHESSLLDPFEVLTVEDGARRVPLPRTPSGQERLEYGEFGVLTWYLMLAERLPLRDALAAVDGWGGDSYVTYRQGGASCARLTFAGDTARDTDRMASTLGRWASATPRTATVSRDSGRVTLQSCDPGSAAAGGRDASQDALALATTRTFLGIGLMRTTPAHLARCVAGRLVQLYPVADLSRPTFGADDPAVQARVRQIAARCR